MNPWLNLESKIKIDTRENTGNNMVYFKFHGTGIIHNIHMNKPVMIGSFRLFVKNGQNDLGFDILMSCWLCKIYKVCGGFWYAGIIPQILDGIKILFNGKKPEKPVGDFPAHDTTKA